MNPIRVIKIGGSLLPRPGLLNDLQSWLSRRAEANLSQQLINVWITGGGARVDAIRKQDGSLALSDSSDHSDSTAHWTSINAMDANATELAQRLPTWRITSDPNQVLQAAAKLNEQPSDLGGPTKKQSAAATSAKSLRPTANWILLTHRWLETAEHASGMQPTLPHNWDVTSDSIAAWVARQLEATELTLLKSCHVPIADLAKLAQLGIVDDYLPTLNLQQHSFRFTCECLPDSLTIETPSPRNHPCS